MHIPPQCEQQTVPSIQSIAAHGSVGNGIGDCIGTQTPPQSAPPVVGSQLSRGSSMQTNPSGQGMPAMPPQKPPGGVSCADAWRRVARPTAKAAAMAATPRRDRELANILAQRSIRSQSIRSSLARPAALSSASQRTKSGHRS
jgi:hypothetical protein